MTNKCYSQPFEIVHTLPDRLEQPLKVKKSKMVFVCSMSDLFHEDLPEYYIDEVFGTMAACPQHTFLLLTKRPERMRDYILNADRENVCWATNMRLGRSHFGDSVSFPLPNVWPGVTVENQEQADKRIPVLRDIPAAKRFVSVEPMLEAINLGEWLAPSLLDWVICGGETGPNARPMHPDWVRSLRSQCRDAAVPFHFKQWGRLLPQSQMTPGVHMNDRDAPGPDNKFIPLRSGHESYLLDGELVQQMPEA